MTDEFQDLREQAYAVRFLYLAGDLTYPEAATRLKAYVTAANQRSQTLAEKYHQKPQRVTVSGFLKGAL